MSEPLGYAGAERESRMRGRGGYREVTLAAIVFGVIFGGIMNAAITYAGLKIGFTLSGSAIAAVLGFGILRGVLRRGSILETNIAQTIASTVNTTNAGIIFTVPVLLLLANDPLQLSFSEPKFWWITLAGTAGALLGCVFIVPLRKQMLDIERLRFPSAVAVSAILKSPGAGTAKAIVLLVGAIVGALIFLPTALPDLGGPGYGRLGLAAVSDTTVDVGSVVGLPPQMPLVFAIAPFAIGAGYLTGAPGLFVLAGGILAYLVLTPLAYNFGWMPAPTPAAAAAGYARAAFNQPLGIGLLLGGAR
jgi:putative OPT family oligopeptide transporter